MPIRKSSVNNMSALERRSIFAENLRQLLISQKSIVDVCNKIGVHRSQFNRFLNSESHPKLDVLHRICNFFGTDARILLEPLANFQPTTEKNFEPTLMLLHPRIRAFFQIGDNPEDTNILPCGFYKFTRQSFILPDSFQSGLIYIHEINGRKFSKGFMTKDVARKLGVNPLSGADREYRGAVFGTDRGVVSMAAHKNSKSCSFTYLDVKTIVEKTFLYGYCARTMPETGSIPSVSRVIYEKIPDDFDLIRTTYRSCGFIRLKDIPELYRTLLSEAV